MYRIVIADDEEYVRDLLAKSINGSGHGFEVVGKAENAIEAIKLVKDLKPDILITDICMPLANGLELIKAINQLGKDIKTVIISGYDDFSYAKSALTLGVTDYLLKPFLPEEMLEVLDKIKEELERQKILLNNMSEMKNQFENTLVFLQQRFLNDIIQNPLEIKDAFAEGKKIRLDLEAVQYCSGIVRIRPNCANNQWNSKNQKMVEDFLRVIKDEYFINEIKTFAVSLDDKQLVIIFCGNYKNQVQFYKEIQSGMEKINQSLKKYYHMHLWCALGNIYCDWKQISISYKEALSVWKGLLNNADGIIRYEDTKKNKASTGIVDLKKDNELENHLLLNIQMGKKDKALELLDEVFVYYQKFDTQLSEFVSVSLVELVFSISNAIIEAGGNTQVWEDKNIIEYLKKHFSYGNLIDAQNALEEYVEKCCEQFLIINEKQGDKIIYNVKMLIEQNLANEEFNLVSASAELFFSHNYIRQVFKQKTGESFMEYLIRRRMETAVEFLKNPVFKIHEIALKTGYSNQRYFASCFKKYFGCTPTEYREQFEKNN